jgi:hypothetical protein
MHARCLTVADTMQEVQCRKAVLCVKLTCSTCAAQCAEVKGEHDVTNMQAHCHSLPSGRCYVLSCYSMLALAGVVLFPGCQLPLLLSTAAEQHLLERALAAPPPLTRLLAVLPG